MFVATVGAISVSGSGYAANAPVLHVCSLSGDPTGVLTVTYPNGRPVSLAQETVTLRVCGTAQGCVTVEAILIQTGPGAYSYSFTVPSAFNGAVTVTLPAGSLTDSYGTSFPSSDTAVVSCAPVPEFNETAFVVLSALAASLFLLRRSRQ